MSKRIDQGQASLGSECDESNTKIIKEYIEEHPMSREQKWSTTVSCDSQAMTGQCSDKSQWPVCDEC